MSHAVDLCSDAAYARVSQLSLTSFQHRDTRKTEPEVFDSFREKALVRQGPNALLASSAGLVSGLPSHCRCALSFESHFLSSLR